MYVCTSVRIITCCIRLSEAMNHLARTQRERDCHQAKIDSEIYLCFLLNEHGDQHLLLHNFGLQIILFKIKN